MKLEIEISEDELELLPFIARRYLVDPKAQIDISQPAEVLIPLIANKIKQQIINTARKDAIAQAESDARKQAYQHYKVDYVIKDPFTGKPISQDR